MEAVPEMGGGFLGLGVSSLAVLCSRSSKSNLLGKLRLLGIIKEIYLS
jgi:hypothetical protein